LNFLLNLSKEVAEMFNKCIPQLPMNKKQQLKKRADVDGWSAVTNKQQPIEGFESLNV
jgi:hypothetical protein